MTAKSLTDRLSHRFNLPPEEARHLVRYPSDPRLGDLYSHGKWLQSGGRFGARFTLKGRSVQFTRANLDAINLARSILEGTNFVWSNLRCASFKEAHLRNLRFEGCDLEGADFTGAVFENVQFIDNVDFDKAIFTDVTVQDGEQNPLLPAVANIRSIRSVLCREKAPAI